MRCEFATHNTEDTLATMVENAYVNHIPVLTGGVGLDQLREFYSRRFIPQMPPDTAVIPVSRTIGTDQLVDEMVFTFTHTMHMDWMLPGLAPTGKRVEVPLVAIVRFRDGKVAHEHIYWDQASVLAQLGLIDPDTLPVAGVASARKLLNTELPSNRLMVRASGRAAMSIHPPQPDADGWNAADYAQHSSLQAAMAAEVLALLTLQGSEHVLDVGCGDGKLTARIADQYPSGSVVGVDSSPDMIAFASDHFGSRGSEGRPNLRFAVADARALNFDREFDVLLSFNALHWVPEQAAALQGIRAALKPSGRAHLRLVTKGIVTSLEELAEVTRRRDRWAAYFEGFQDPYLRLTPQQYAALATSVGLQVLSLSTQAKAWDFKTKAAFFGFCSAGFGAWTQRLSKFERGPFVEDVMNAYRAAVSTGAEDACIFRFYQTDITLAPTAL